MKSRDHRAARPVSFLLHPPLAFSALCAPIVLTFTPLAVFLLLLLFFLLAFLITPLLFFSIHPKMVSAILMKDYLLNQ